MRSWRTVLVVFLVAVWQLPIFQGVLETREVRADVSDLVVTGCDVTDVADATCYSAVSADGGSSYALIKGAHIDAQFQTVSASAINSATLYYDSWGSLSGTWSIEVTATRDGTVLCSVNPAPENGSETSNSTSCTISTSQLAAGVWLRATNNDDKGPESINLDYVRLNVDYTAAATISVSVSDGTVAFGTIAASAEEDTTATGVNDTQTATNDGSVTEDFNIKTSAASGGTAWSPGAAAGSDVFVMSFSTNSGSSWEPLQTVDTYETLVTGVTTAGNQTFDLKIGTPTASSDYQQKTITVTVQAVQP